MTLLLLGSKSAASCLLGLLVEGLLLRYARFGFVLISTLTGLFFEVGEEGGDTRAAFGS